MRYRALERSSYCHVPTIRHSKELWIACYFPLDLIIIQMRAPASTSSDDDSEIFFEEPQQAKAQCKSQDPQIIIGNCKAK